MARQMTGERLDEIFAMTDLESGEPRDYDGLHVGVGGWRYTRWLKISITFKRGMLWMN